jgi:hypothetical protein
LTRIFSVELRRFAWRRSFRVFGLVALAGIAVAAVIVFFNSDRSTNTPGLARFESDVEHCTSSFEGHEEDIPPGFDDAEDFCRGEIVVFESADDRFRLETLQDVFQGTSVPLIILGLALGASFIGAEWHTGTLTTLLTWEPRRTRVMVSKVLAVVFGVFVSAVALQTVLGLVMWPIAALRGTTEGVDAGWLVDSAAVIARGALIAGLAAAIGFAVASVARNTTTALIIGFVYFAVAEAILRGLRPNWQEWLIGDNAAAFVSADPESVFSFGEGHGVLASLLVVVAYAGGFVVAATAWFRARDVT